MLITPLKGSNYPTWKLQCKMGLMRDGVWGIVSGDEEAPEAGTDAYPKFAVRRDRALATIVLSIDPSLLYLIGDPEDPSVVWKKLGDQFQKKSWANKLHLRKRLHTLRLKDGDSVQTHIKEMTEIFSELSIIGDKISDEDRVVYLLASLPDSFTTLVTALEANTEVPKMDVVTERLLYEEKKLIDRATTSIKMEAGAMSVKHKVKSKGPKCYGCHNYGHIQRNCPNVSKQSHNRDGQRERSKRPKSEKTRTTVKHSIHKTEEVNSDSDVGLAVTHNELNSVGESQDRGSTDSSCWIVDSGATCHICHDKALFTQLTSLRNVQEVTLGDGRNLRALGSGTVELELVLPNGEPQRKLLHDVLYVPGLSYNLLSVTKMTDKGRKIKFRGSSCEVVDGKNRVIALAIKRGAGLYHLMLTKSPNHTVNTAMESKEFLWHRRFGHIGEASLKMMTSEQLVKGLDYDVSKPVGFCESCVMGKTHRNSFPTSGRRRGEAPLQIVHSDVCGKMNTKSLSGGEYFLTLIDDYSHFTWVYIMKHKHEVFRQFKNWKAMVEKGSGYQLKVLRTDNGGEYTSNEFQDYLQQEGIRHELTVPKTPEQNGVAERMNRTLIEATRSMLDGAHLPQRFWAETLSTAVYLRNRCSTKAVRNATPFEVWFKEKPRADHLRVFGCTAFAHVAKDERGKLDSKARRCILLGYGTETKGYRLYYQMTKRVFLSRDVVFNESEVKGLGEKTSNPEKPLPLIELPLSGAEVEVKDSDLRSDEEEETPTLRRSGRVRQRPDYYGAWVNSIEQSDTAEPTSVLEALSNCEKKEWKKAMESEMRSIEENDVWELVELPEGKRLVGSKWVFKRKIGADGVVDRYKARLVAQGFSQRSGVDYDETFCPVVRFESLRTLIATAVQQGMLIHQMDVTSAFLNGRIEEEVYMKQPEGFINQKSPHLVCKLKHSLYSLKQAPRCWNSTLDKSLKEMGFKQSHSDPCVYMMSEDESLLILGIYVDDIVICGKSLYRIEAIKKDLSDKFKVKDLGELKYFLGVNVIQNHSKGTVWLGQQTYTNNVLGKFGFDNARSVNTPTNPGMKLMKGTDESELVDQSMYQSAVGSLLYLATKTRPDISFAVGTVARYCSKPTTEHWTAVKRIFRYLKGTSDLGLLYKPHQSRKLVGYSDADWGGDGDDYKSTSVFRDRRHSNKLEQ